MLEPQKNRRQLCPHSLRSIESEIFLTARERAAVSNLTAQDLQTMLELQVPSLSDYKEDIVAIRTEDIFGLFRAVASGGFELGGESFMDKKDVAFYVTPNPDSVDLQAHDAYADIRWEMPKGLDEPTFDAIIQTNDFQYGTIAVQAALARDLLPVIRPKLGDILRDIHEHYRHLDSTDPDNRAIVEEVIDELANCSTTKFRNNFAKRAIRDAFERSDQSQYESYLQNVSDRAGVLVAFNKSLLLYEVSGKKVDDENEITCRHPSNFISMNTILGIEVLGDWEDDLLVYLQNMLPSL